MAESEVDSVSSLSGSKSSLKNENCSETTKEKEKRLSILRYGHSKKKKPLIKFSVKYIFSSLPTEERVIAAKWHLAYKFVKTECKIVRTILHQHCFKEVHPNSSDFNLMWTGSHLKPQTLCGMREYQKINHFPRSYELTRKDRLYQNIQKMQHSKGYRNFDFIPEAYVLPAEYNHFCSTYSKLRGLWIVKPVASSRGRGIFLVNHPNQIPLDETLLVSKYIANPLLVDGFKFDLRLYVGVTSFDPLRIYLYEEGLTRFATVKYDRSNKNIKNSCMHLTNYSVNKKNDDYVSCNDPNIEDYGNKWSFGALLRFLKTKGVDTTTLVGKIEDLVIKTIISGELSIATACKMFMPFPGNCFEIYGFDVLIDDNLKPWLLEVNLSPSMACDAPMDLKIKSNLLTDMLNLTGFQAQDPLLKKPTKPTSGPYVRNFYQRQRCQSAGLVMSKELSSSYGNIPGKTKPILSENERGLTTEELHVLRETKEEYTRRGHFVRIFPSSNSRELYGSYLGYRTTNNRMLFARLFVDKLSSHTPCPENENSSTEGHATYLYGQTLPERMNCYERQIPSVVGEQHSSPHIKSSVYKADIKYPGQNSLLAQGQLEVRSSQVICTDQSNTSLAIKPPPPPPQENLQIKNVIQKAAFLSKLQARKAFGMYLQRVRQRLVQEVSCDYDDSGDEDEKAKQDEQMSLVIRFLKRAARNLRQEFRVVVPSHKLPMQDRRRMLAQQLGDFVHIYDKETAQIKEKPSESNEHSQESLSKEDFDIFLRAACESELEELLTVYTRVNNNTSIFLGKATIKPTGSLKTFKSPLPRQMNNATETRKHVRSHSAHALSSPSKHDYLQKNDQSSARIQSDTTRRLVGAVAAYGKSLAYATVKKRPASANFSSERKRVPVTTTTRPVSAKIMREKSVIPSYEATPVNATSEKSVSEALKIIAKRQAVRQYAARQALKIEPNKWVLPGTSGDKPRNSVDNNRTDRGKHGMYHAVVPSSKSTTFMDRETRDENKTELGLRVDSRHSNADETFFSFVNHELHVTSKPSHQKISHLNKATEMPYTRDIREPIVSEEIGRSVPIRIPCGNEDQDMAGEDVLKRLGSARDDYNKHMQLLIERLAAHKFDGTKEEKVVPKPPSRPRSAKRTVSTQRMARITTGHNNP